MFIRKYTAVKFDSSDGGENVEHNGVDFVEISEVYLI